MNSRAASCTDVSFHSVVLKQETQKAKVLDPGPGKTRRGHGVIERLLEVMEKGIPLRPWAVCSSAKLSW